MDAMFEKVKFEGEQADAVFVKNLFQYDSKKKDKVFLICVAHTTIIDSKALMKHLKCTSLRNTKPEVLTEMLGVQGGSVNLFSIINDTDKKV
jgi:Ala-tRNA(Pro) deacylase